MAQRKQGVSPELDELSSTLVGDALDMLAEGEDVNVLLVVEDNLRNVASYVFSDDGAEALIEGAYQRVRDLARKKGDREAGLGEPQRYALVYEGAIEDEDGSFVDALLLECGERGWQAYSAYSLYQGKGLGDEFAWTDPAPAGEMDCLL